MPEGDERISRALPVAASALFVAVASGYLLFGRLLHYATLGVGHASSATVLALAALLVAVFAFAHERVVRGALYAALRARLSSGLAAPVVALVGAAAPVTARLVFLPRGAAPLPVVLGQALLVEFSLGLGLAWLALGSGSWLFSGIALAALGVVKTVVAPVFHGGVIPFLELVFAVVAALSVALVLKRPLTPYRESLMGVS